MKNKLLKRIDELQTIISEYENRITDGDMIIMGTNARTKVYDIELFQQIKSSSASLVLSLYGKEHPFYIDLEKQCKDFSSYERINGILKSIKTEIQGDWLLTIKSLLSAEIFSDFLEMSEHLLNENYKDAAAVMIGSVLEEHLRQLSISNGNPILDLKDRPKKANLLNAEIVKLGVYNKLDEKNVTAWLDLRNKAAHGKYPEYNKEQVELMLTSVTDFISRNPIK